jgi:hypothetical protein
MLIFRLLGSFIIVSSKIKIIMIRVIPVWCGCFPPTTQRGDFARQVKSVSFLGNATESFSLPLRLFAWRLQGISFLAWLGILRFSLASPSVAVSTQLFASPSPSAAMRIYSTASLFFAVPPHHIAKATHRQS